MVEHSHVSQGLGSVASARYWGTAHAVGSRNRKRESDLEECEESGRSQGQTADRGTKQVGSERFGALLGVR